MNKLYTKVDNLKIAIEDLDVMKNIDLYGNKIIKNKELTSKINKYKENGDENLKFDIYKYDEFIKYKKCETEINLLIMKINNKLKKITGDGGCCESN